MTVNNKTNLYITFIYELLFNKFWIAIFLHNNVLLFVALFKNILLTYYTQVQV